MEFLKSRTNLQNNRYVTRYMNVIVENRRTLIMIALFTVGMLLGATIVKDSSSTVSLKLIELFDRYRQLRGTQSILSNFCSSMLTSIVFMSLVFVFGLCAIGTPVIGAIPFIRGLGMGMISGHLYGAYALNGLGYSLLVIYPGALISIIGLLMCCNESVLMSQDIFLIMMNKTTKNQSGIKMYCARYLAIILIAVAGAVVDSVCVLAFTGFFKF